MLCCNMVLLYVLYTSNNDWSSLQHTSFCPLPIIPLSFVSVCWRCFCVCMCAFSFKVVCVRKNSTKEACKKHSSDLTCSQLMQQLLHKSKLCLGNHYYSIFSSIHLFFYLTFFSLHYLPNVHLYSISIHVLLHQYCMHTLFYDIDLYYR